MCVCVCVCVCVFFVPGAGLKCSPACSAWGRIAPGSAEQPVGTWVGGGPSWWGRRRRRRKGAWVAPDPLAPPASVEAEGPGS